jgi:hypothetical protein
MRQIKAQEKVAILAISAAIAFLASTLCGCSLISIANPDDIIKHPLGTESVRLGMTKQQVESLWGRPDEIRHVENREKWKGMREMWVYRAEYGSIPVDAGYLSKTKKLYFDGPNLTEISE